MGTVKLNFCPQGSALGGLTQKSGECNFPSLSLQLYGYSTIPGSGMALKWIISSGGKSMASIFLTWNKYQAWKQATSPSHSPPEEDISHRPSARSISYDILLQRNDAIRTARTLKHFMTALHRKSNCNWKRTCVWGNHQVSAEQFAFDSNLVVGSCQLWWLNGAIHHSKNYMNVILAFYLPYLLTLFFSTFIWTQIRCQWDTHRPSNHLIAHPEFYVRFLTPETINWVNLQVNVLRSDLIRNLKQRCQVPRNEIGFRSNWHLQLSLSAFLL